MKKEKSLAEKIKDYSTLALSILAVGKTADAQVIYTDVIPDTTIYNGIYGLDLNNDGVTDFNLSQIAATSSSSGSSSSFIGVAISPIGENAFINKPDTISISSYQIPFPSPDILNFNDSINANRNWQQIIPPTSTSSSGTNSFFLGIDVLYYGILAGNWMNAGEHYLGLKFKIGASFYYGWARVVLGDSATNFTLKDYAYYADSNKAILAGQKFSDAINEIIKPENQLYKLFIEDKKLSISILKNEIIGGKLEVLNTAGQVVTTMEIDKNEFVLDLKMISSGMYFVRAGKDEKFQTTKILITR